MRIEPVTVKDILTRASGYLEPVCSHSLNPYVGCPLGRSLCGTACYVQHNRWITRGRPWGTFLLPRIDAAQSYTRTAARERRWARRTRGAFGVFLASSTEPFPPQERTYRVTGAVLEAMGSEPPDILIVQTHSHFVTGYLDLLVDLARRCDLRVHFSIETDRERIPGLPPPASSVEKRFGAAAELRGRGLRTVITVSPLLPIEAPEAFFRRVREAADAVVLDHYIGGDGTPDGHRTARTALPAAIGALEPEALTLSYRDRMVEVARQVMPAGSVGVGCDGFAGRFLR